MKIMTQGICRGRPRRRQRHYQDQDQDQHQDQQIAFIALCGVPAHLMDGENMKSFQRAPPWLSSSIPSAHINESLNAVTWIHVSTKVSFRLKSRGTTTFCPVCVTLYGRSITATRYRKRQVEGQPWLGQKYRFCARTVKKFHVAPSRQRQFLSQDDQQIYTGSCTAFCETTLQLSSRYLG